MSRYLVSVHGLFCAESTSHGATREREKLAKRVSHRSV